MIVWWEVYGIYPLVSADITDGKDPPCYQWGKSTISTGWCSIAMLNYQRVHLDFVKPQKTEQRVVWKNSFSCVLHYWTTNWGTGPFWSHFMFRNSVTEELRVPPLDLCRFETSFQTEVFFVGKAWTDGVWVSQLIHKSCYLNPHCSRHVMEYDEHGTTTSTYLPPCYRFFWASDYLWSPLVKHITKAFYAAYQVLADMLQHRGNSELLW